MGNEITHPLIGIWRVLESRQRRRLLLLLILSAIMGFCTVGGIAAVLPFFAVLADPHVIDEVPVLSWLYQRFEFDSHRQFVVALGACFAAAVLLANVVNLAGTVAMNRFALSVGSEFQVTLFDAYLHRGYAFHARVNSATLTSKLIHETGRVTIGVLQGGLTVIANLIAIALIVASVILVNPLAASIAIAVLGASYLLTYALARRRLRDSGRIESRFAVERSRVISESLGAIKEITVAQRQDFFVEKFARSCRSISRALADTFIIGHSPKYILESLAVGGLVGIALLLSGRQAAVGPWLAQLTFVGFAAYRLLPALQHLFAALVKIRAERAAFESIAEDLRLARARPARARVVDPSWRGRPRNEVRLQAVSFRYGDDLPPAIRDVSLAIPGGAMIALVGANGSGKTTLADVIAGLLAPQSGSIEVDGIVLNESNRADWMSQVAYVPQDIFLLDATVAENIALGVAPQEIDRSRLLRAARQARLDECIDGLPKKYDEVLGERGVRLSGGQRQRVGIARALYRDAVVLIMDEATNALDDMTQREVITTLHQLRGDRTIILITHALSTLRHCDLIVAMQSGTIVSRWTRDESVALRARRRRRSAIAA